MNGVLCKQHGQELRIVHQFEICNHIQKQSGIKASFAIDFKEHDWLLWTYQNSNWIVTIFNISKRRNQKNDFDIELVKISMNNELKLL